MEHGDIDNGVPKRVLAHISCCFTKEIQLRKTLWVFTTAHTEWEVSMLDLAFWQRWANAGLVMDSFYFSDDGYPADDLWALLDQYSHPFRQLMQFRNSHNLADYLAYQKDVVRVVDPLHPMAYGFMSTEAVSGSL